MAKGGRRWRIFYGSEPMPHKAIRAKVRQMLRFGVEPEPKYRTGKMWDD